MKKLKPEEILYHQKASTDSAKSSLSDEPLGSLAIAESITAGSPRWRTHGHTVLVPDLEHKKTLIYNDPCWTWYSAKKQGWIDLLLHRQVSKGFKVYVCMNNQLASLDTSQTFEGLRQDFTQLDPETIDQQLSQLNIDTQECSLLDYPSLQTLINPDFDNTLILSDFKSEHQKQAIELLGNGESFEGVAVTLPEEVALLRTNWGEDAGLAKIINISTEKFNKEQFPDILNKLSQLQHLTLANISSLDAAPPDNFYFTFLRRINIHKSTTSGLSLLKLLKAAPHIIILSLNYCNNLDRMSVTDLPLDISWEDFETLAVTETDWNINEIFTFICRTPNIISLQATKLRRENRWNIEPERFRQLAANIRWESLQTISFEKLTVQGELLFELLSKSQNLTALYLVNCNISNGLTAALFDTLDPSYWSALKTIDLSNSTLSAEVIFEIIRRAPNLENLILRNCKNLASLQAKSFQDLGTLHWSALKTIDFSQSTISGDVIFEAMYGALNLKILNLCNCKNLASFQAESVNRLDSSFTWLDLQEIKIDKDCSLPPSTYLALALRAPKLTSFDFSLFKDTQSKDMESLTIALFEKSPVNFQWKDIKTLTVQGNVAISSPILLEILRRALSIISLELESYGNRQSFFVESITSLPSEVCWPLLKNIKASSGRISFKALSALSSRMPTLEKIELTAYNFSSFTPKEFADCISTANWSSLKDLTMILAAISGAALLAILCGTTQITSLTLINCSQHFSLSAESIRRLPANIQWPHLQRIKAEYSDIPRDTLTALLERTHPECRIGYSNPILSENFSHSEDDGSEFTPKHSALPFSSEGEEQDINFLPGPSDLSALSNSKAGAKSRKTLASSETVPAETNPTTTTLKPTNQLLALKNAPAIHFGEYRQSIVFYEAINLRGQEIVIVEPNKIPSTAAPYENFESYPSKKELTRNISEKLDTEKYHYYEAFVEILPGEQPLVTGSVNNQLIAMLEPPPGCRFYYDKQRDQYYVDYKGETAATLRYVLAVPKESPQEALLPKEIQKICEYFKDFQQKPLTSEPKTATDKLQAMHDQQVGSCVQRSIACLKELNEKKHTARLISNGIHAYIEVLNDQQWIRVNLGGYPVDLDISPPPEDTIELLAADKQDSAETNPAAGITPADDDDITPVLAIPQMPITPAFDLWLKEITQRDAEVKQCWTFSSNEETGLAAKLLLQAYTSQEHFVYIINHPNQLRCLIDALILTDKNDFCGTLKSKPTGPLADFLREKAPRTLMIDWNAFEPEEVAKYLGLLDGNFDGSDTFETLTIPLGLRVLSLQNTKRETAYRSEDFLTRHGSDKPCPLSHAELKLTGATETESTPATSKRLLIDLYHADNWEKYIFGQWLLKPEGYIFEPTECWKALCAEEACVLHLMNPPLHEPHFERFKLLIESKLPFSYVGQTFQHSKIQFKIIPTPKELWQKRCEFIKLIENHATTRGADKETWVLNSVTLSSFLHTEIVDADGNLLLASGLLEQHLGSSCRVIASHTLNASQWAMLLDAAQRYQVTLEISCLRGVSLPRELQAYLPKQKMIASSGSSITDKTAKEPKVIYTKNINETARRYRTALPDAFCQTITGSMPRDIFYEYNVEHFNINNGHFSGCRIEKEGAILQALLTGRTVILTGSLTPELEAFFAPLLCSTPPYLFFNNQRHLITGQLILITDTELSFVKTIEHDKTPRHRPPAALLKSPAQTVPDLPSLQELQHAADAVKQLHSQRLGELEKVFQHSRIATLVGPTGCGKTSFMKTLKKVYWGLTALDNFIREGDEDSILFIDEANLSDPHVIEKLMDLLQEPPCLWHKRVRHPIKGKVVLAINPKDYGNGREESEVLNHSAAISFQALPLAVLYEQSIAPALRAAGIPVKLQLEIGQQWLSFYRDCLTSNTKALCISPRELEAIALAFATCYTQTKPKDPILLAKSITYHFAKTLLPEDKLPEKPAKAELLPLPKNITFENGDGFIFLKEHQEAWTLLNYILQGQAFNRKKSLGLHGICHVSLMGESNIGKSAFLRAACQALKQSSTFLPASALLSVQRETLATAAQQGGILIHDEANMTHLERELNAYLMGLDLDGESLPSKEPFIYLSTGNPAKRFAGRREKSVAEERRQCCIQMPKLSHESQMRLAQELHPEQKKGARVRALLPEPRLSPVAKAIGVSPSPSSAFPQLENISSLAQTTEVTTTTQEITLERIKIIYKEYRDQQTKLPPLSFGCFFKSHATLVLEAKTTEEIKELLEAREKANGSNASTLTLKEIFPR